MLLLHIQQKRLPEESYDATQSRVITEIPKPMFVPSNNKLVNKNLLQKIKLTLFSCNSQELKEGIYYTSYRLTVDSQEIERSPYKLFYPKIWDQVS